MAALEEKQERLAGILRECGTVLVAYSGGVDSSLLLQAAAEALGPANVVAVTARAPIYPDMDEEALAALPRRLGVKHILTETRQLADEVFVRNPPDRCYYCKAGVLKGLAEIAAREGMAVIVEGSNVDDLADYRPGEKAVRESGARSPLRDAGLAKPEIRELACRAGIPVWNKPAESCLAARFPYGAVITAAALERVRRSERVLKDLGFTVVRVRDYGDLARIEVPPDEVSRLVSPDVGPAVAAALQKLGYTHVSADLQGYRRGSLNESLNAPRGEGSHGK